METQEQIVKKMHPHFTGFLKFYFITVLFIAFGIFFIKFFPEIIIGVIVIIIGIFIFLMGEIARRAETFYVLDNGVAREYKMLSTSRKFAEYSKIQNMEVNQSFTQTMFHVGNIKFDTAGTDLIEVSFNGVKDPYGIEKIVREKITKK